MSKYAIAGVSISIAILSGLPLQIGKVSAQALPELKTESKNEADRLLQAGLRYLETYKSTEAIQAFERSLQIYQQIGDRPNESKVLNILGNFYDSVGEYKEAIRLYQKSLIISQKLGDRSSVGNALY